ncbi:DUF6134 family protein [Thalassospira lohafexi]|uniref:Uncharacterized protein n=1 Tax=Thalassospira lohafexi TaxID=744227 RepID=A0A2N3L5F9_9PROT|nr:DUF6134 family protein [Thalassospira lohafexi]PKR57976.1 hypothetical protein COO92_14595 [Thalassospira lohafexi]
MIAVRKTLPASLTVTTISLLTGLLISANARADDIAGPNATGKVAEISALTSAFDSPQTCRNFDPIERYGNELRFQIRRNDSPVGSHIVQFHRGTDGIQVVAQSNIDISFLGFNAYSFRYRSESLWQDGKLAALSVKVDDDGEQTTINAKQDNGQLLVTGPDGEKDLPDGIFPTDHWNCGVLNSTSVLNTLTGNANDVTIQAKDREQLRTTSGTLMATHFTYSGDLITNAWYDQDGRWVGLQFEANDGSTIIYRCMNCMTRTGQKDRG